MGSDLFDYQTATLVAAVFALAMVMVVRAKAWQSGEAASAPAHLRVFLATFAAMFVLFLCLDLPDRRVQVAAMLPVSALWLAALHDNTPLLSAAFARKWGYALAACAALWLVYETFLLFGVDLAARARAAA